MRTWLFVVLLAAGCGGSIDGTWLDHGIDSSKILNLHGFGGDLSGDGMENNASLRTDVHFTVTGSTSTLVFHFPDGSTDTFHGVELEGDTLTLSRNADQNLYAIYHRQ
jgi:hypothetical protein